MTHDTMRGSIGAVALALLLGGTAGAQSGENDPATRAADHAAAARKLFDEGHAESAALRMRAALRAAEAIADANERHGVSTKLTAKMKTFDPLWTAEVAARKSAARTLLLAGEEEQRRNWVSMARVLFEAAARVLPGSADVALASLGSTTNSATERAPNERHFAEATNPLGESGWTFDEDSIRSPRLDGASVMLVGSESLGPQQSLHFQVRTGPDLAKVALAFGVTPEHQYHLLELRHDYGFSQIRLFYYDGRQLLTLDDQFATFSRAERAAWMSIEIDVDGPSIRARIGGDVESVEGKSRVPSIEGKLGLFVSGDSPNAEPMEFRLVRARGE